MNDLVKIKLFEILENHGNLIYLDEKRLEGLLKDLCGAYKREINLVMAAVRSGVAKELLSYNENIPLESLLKRLANRLAEEHGLKNELAGSTVNLIALSLKLITEDRFNRSNSNREDDYRNGNDSRDGRDNYTRKENSSADPPVIKVYKTGAARSFYLGAGVVLDMLYIAPGAFIMGDDNGRDDEKPAHKVKITKGFWIGKYPVTREQYKIIMKSDPSHFKKSRNHPVENVSWNDCRNFIVKLNGMKLAEEKFHLPSEAEWEYACRAGTASTHYWGYDFDGNYCWYAGNSKSTCPVGLKKPNKWGLYDMCGNVWEWCADWYGSYSKQFQTDPEGPVTGSNRVARGGGWDSLPENCRSALRYINFTPSYHNNSLGFRVCLS